MKKLYLIITAMCGVFSSNKTQADDCVWKYKYSDGSIHTGTYSWTQGAVETIYDCGSRKSVYGYDSNGKTISRSYYTDDKLTSNEIIEYNGNQMVSSTYYSYDGDGNVQSESISTGYYEGRSYWPSSTVSYSCTNGICEQSAAHLMEFDNYGNILSDTNYSCSDGNCIANGYWSIYGYDALGHVQDANGYYCNNGECLQRYYDDYVNGRYYSCNNGVCTERNDGSTINANNLFVSDTIPETPFCLSGCNVCSPFRECMQCADGYKLSADDSQCYRIRYTMSEAYEATSDDNENYIEWIFK